jgi:hypothetical protein
VTGRRLFVLVILLYVTVDLSVAAMPGAFVFDASDSVESLQMTRVRPVADVPLDSAPTPDAGALIVQVDVRHRRLPPRRSAVPRHAGDSSRRKAPEPPGLSEDPH